MRSTAAALVWAVAITASLTARPALAQPLPDWSGVWTMVGGRVVYDAANEPSTSTK